MRGLLNETHGRARAGGFNRRLAVALACIVLCACALACSSLGKRAAERAGPEMREVTDEVGRRVRVPAHPERVVSLAPNLTEIVYAVGAGNRLVGDTTYCDYPEEAKGVAKVGDTLNPSIERIIALRPQLILVTTASQLDRFTRQLEEFNITVYVTSPRDLEGIFRSIESLGDLLDQRAQGQKVAADLRARASAVEERVRGEQPVRVFYQVSREPLYTAGQESFMTDLIRRAGGVNVTADVPGAWPRYSDEAALATRPEAIIIPVDDSMNGGDTQVSAALLKSPAAQKNRVYKINGDYLSRPGPRLVEGLEQMARALHPSVFK